MLKTKLGRINILIYQEIVVKENGAVGVGVDELEQELLRIKLLIKANPSETSFTSSYRELLE